MKGSNNAQIKSYEAGSFCIALWSEDNTWYNGLINKVNKDGSCLVEFVDYGNVETVAADKIVGEVEEIPGGCNVDKCVGEEGMKNVTSELVERNNIGMQVKEDIDMNEETLSSQEPELKERVVNEEELETEEKLKDPLVISQIVPVIPRPLKTDLPPTTTDQSNTILPDQNPTASPV